jgi:hypothetical protein
MIYSAAAYLVWYDQPLLTPSWRQSQKSIKNNLLT